MAKKPWVRPRWRDEGAALDLQREEDAVTRAITQVLDEMPARRREVATLRLREQLPTAAICVRLNLSPWTVRYHVRRAREVMRVRLPRLLAAQEEAR